MSEKQTNNFDFLSSSKENRVLSDSLARWIEIYDSEQFDKIVKLLKDNKIIDLSKNSFSSLSPGRKWISIKRFDNNTVKVYWLYESNISIIKKVSPNLWYLVWWTIKSGETFQESSLSVSYSNLSDRYLRDTNNLSEKVLEQLEQIKQDSIVKIESVKKDVEQLQYEPYTIQKWDNLWKIVKEKYGLDNNRDIANAINALVSYNNGVRWLKNDNNPEGWDGIKWDKLIAWKTIKIPAKLTVLWKEMPRKK